MKQLFISVISLATLLGVSTSAFGLSPDDKNMVIENDPVAIGANGPVLQFRFVIVTDPDDDEEYAGLAEFERPHYIQRIEVVRLSTGKIIQQVEFPDFTLSQREASVTLTDINFDGYKDLYIQFSSGATNSTYEGSLFEPDAGVFKNDWITLMNPKFDVKNQQIIELSCGGCACEDYTRTFYQVYDGAMLLVKQEHQEVCGVGEKFYSLSERIDGDMVETVRKDMSDEY